MRRRGAVKLIVGLGAEEDFFEQIPNYRLGSPSNAVENWCPAFPGSMRVLNAHLNLLHQEK